MGVHRRCEIKQHPPFLDEKCPICLEREAQSGERWASVVTAILLVAVTVIAITTWFMK